MSNNLKSSKLLHNRIRNRCVQQLSQSVGEFIVHFRYRVDVLITETFVNSKINHSLVDNIY